MNAAVLVDWENFFHGREHNAGEDFDVNAEVTALCEFARGMVEEFDPEIRISVWRAYADFNARRQNQRETGSYWDYYLQRTPATLMQHGIEPIQVFRFPGGSGKNAADMRLTVDGLRLRTDETGIGVFVIVSGDADFIPLAIDLRRLGAHVLSIGLQGQTKQVLQRYVDRFEFFEDLAAAVQLTTPQAQGLSAIGDALKGMLEEREVIPFKAVKPMLNRRLSTPFEPERFDAKNTGDFLRANSRELGVSVRKATDDWEMIRRDETVALDLDGSTECEPTIALYRQALRGRMPKLFELTPEQWKQVAPAVVRVFEQLQEGESIDGDGLIEAVEYAIGESESMEDEDAARVAKSGVMQLLVAGVFKRRDTGAAVRDARRESREASLVLGDAYREPAELVQAANETIVRELVRRAPKARGTGVRVDARVVAELIFDREVADDELSYVAALISQYQREGARS